VRQRGVTRHSGVALYMLWVLLPGAGASQDNFDPFVPSEVLHGLAIQGRLGSVLYRGAPIRRGMSILTYGAIEGSNVDGNGYYVDLRGVGGVVRCYVPRSELNKLQSRDYVYERLGAGSPREVAIEGTVSGLNQYGNFELRGAVLVPWATALIPARSPTRTPPAPPVAGGGRAGCMPYAPERVNLAGLMYAKEFPGPPGYASVANGDRPEQVWILSLAKPICTKGDGENIPEDGVKELQLVLPQGGKAETLKPFLDQNVILGGQLSHSMNIGRDHTFYTEEAALEFKRYFHDRTAVVFHVVDVMTPKGWVSVQ